MDGREKEYTWSTAYVDNSQVVVVKKNSGITKLSDLAGKNVIVQSDSSALAAFTGEDADEENIRLAAMKLSRVVIHLQFLTSMFQSRNMVSALRRAIRS